MPPKEVRERTIKLRKVINYHRYLYHVLNTQEISDEALDSLKHELEQIEKKYPHLITPDSPTQRVAGKVLKGFKKVRHSFRMISLNDVFSREEIEDWEKRIKKLIPGHKELFAELKVDGFAISLVYENGIFSLGSTRGNGLEGEDVTENLKTIESIPLKLHGIDDLPNRKEVNDILENFPRVKMFLKNIPKKIEIRGEVYITKKSFANVNRSQRKLKLTEFANLRNIAAGSIRQLDSKITASRHLDFLAYDLITDAGQTTHQEEHLIANLMGFTTVKPTRICNSTDDVIKFYEYILKIRESLPFQIDGVVIQVNENDIFDELGIAGKAPRGAVAFKFPPKQSTTVVENIIVQIGRTGVLTPVAILRPVKLGGVMVSRATLHNMDEIERLDVRKGDTVIVERAGDVIPYVVKTLKNLRPVGAKKFQMPKIFCGQPVIRKINEAAHRIPHPEKCELTKREFIYHFVSKNAFDIVGLGPKIIDRLLDEGLIQDAADLFLLKKKDLEILDRFGKKSAENVIASINSRREIELSRFINSLGIMHVGEEISLDIAHFFGKLEKLETSTLEELEKVPNIGETIANSLYNWFKDRNHQEFIEKLKKAEIHIKKSEQIKLSNLSGKLIVLTGSLSKMTRDEAKKLVRGLGGEVSENVSSQTDYLVVGTSPGTKLEKAKNLGVKIINEKEFNKLIR